MCYYVELKEPSFKVKKKFNLEFDDITNYYGGLFVNGFDHPNMPIITNSKPEIITTNHTWGLIPFWSKDVEIQNKTLNARIETIESTASYKNINSNRCLIIASGFFEWRWLDEKGKQKEKYHIALQEQEIFCFAGLYDSWVNPANGVVKKTYTMLTTEANDIMQYVHNHKKRMPIIINEKDEKDYLNPNINLKEFAYPYQSNLIAFKTT